LKKDAIGDSKQETPKDKANQNEVCVVNKED